MSKEYEYVVLYHDKEYPTHFTYNIKDDRIWCTHGAWGGVLYLNEDGSCRVKLGKDDYLEYDGYEFTHATCYNDYVEDL